MAQQAITLAKFGMLCDQREFIHLYWDDERQHEVFLTDCMKEGGIDITPWSALGDAGSAPSLVMQRSVSAWHPLPIQLPWLPLMIRNKCVQTVSYNRQTNVLSIVERSAVNGIPFVQPYVIATWTIAERAVSGQGVPTQLDIHVGLSWEYDVYSFLAGQVEHYSRGAMETYFKAWLPHADALLVAHRKAGGQLGPHGSEGQGALVKALWAPWNAEVQAGAREGAEAGAGSGEGGTWRSCEEQPGGAATVETSPSASTAPATAPATPAAVKVELETVGLWMTVVLFLRGLLDALLRLVRAPPLLPTPQLRPALPSSDEPPAPEPTSVAAEEELLRESAAEALRLSRARPFSGSSVAAGYSGASDSFDSVDSSPDASPSRTWTPEDVRRARRAKIRHVRNLDLDATHTGALNAGAGLLCNLGLDSLFQMQPRRPSIAQRPAFSDAAYRAGPSAQPGPPRRVPDTVVTVHTAEELFS